MKKSDIAMIVFIASLSVMISYFVTNSLMDEANSKPVAVEYATPISAEIQPPSEKVFNKDAINPTVEVAIGTDDGNKTGDAAQDNSEQPQTP